MTFPLQLTQVVQRDGGSLLGLHYPALQQHLLVQRRKGPATEVAQESLGSDESKANILTTPMIHRRKRCLFPTAMEKKTAMSSTIQPGIGAIS